MTADEFAEAIRKVVGDAEDAGLSLPEMVAVLEGQVEAMQRRLNE